jgi:hypothetical protein
MPDNVKVQRDESSIADGQEQAAQDAYLAGLAIVPEELRAVLAAA